MVFIGEIVNTHGIKGELRILSDFKFKNEVFKKGFKFYVGKRKQEVIVKSYRKHKMFDMVTFEGITDINDAVTLKGDLVYIAREDLNIDGYIDEDIIGLSAYDKDKLIGTVDSIIKNKQDILILKNEDKKYMIPFVDELVNVDIINKRVNINVIEGLLDEN